MPLTNNDPKLVLGYNSSSGYIFIDKFSFEDEHTEEIWNDYWQKGYSIIVPIYNINTRTSFIITYKSDLIRNKGKVLIDKVSKKGEGTTEIYNSDKNNDTWPTGYSSIVPIFSNFILFYNSTNGYVILYKGTF